MPFRKTIKSVAKRVYSKGKRAFKKRYVKGGQPNIKNIMADVKMLKHLVNTEKKRVDINHVGQGVGQFAGAVSGNYALSINPTPAQGITGSTRNGLSIKIVSMCMDLQVQQQSGSLNDIKLRYYIVCRPDNSNNPSANTSIGQFLEPNPFSAVNDFWSSRDPEFFTAFRVIKTGVIDVKQDAITGGTTIVQKKIPLKLNHHHKYNTDGTNVTTKNAFYFFAVASGGDTVANTGLLMSYNCRWYFTDN